jgi:outer membrane protein assembly factor BamB
VRGLAALSDGGAVAVGAFDGQLAAGAVSLASAGGGDGFALGLTPAGRVAWGAALAGPGDQELTAVATAPGGAIALAGTSAGPARLSGRGVTTVGEPGAIVARIEAGGGPAWVRPIAATGYAVPTALAWTGDGDLVVAGYYAGTLDPTAAALPGAGSLDVWVARLAGADGRVQWMHRAGGPGADAARALAVTSGGAVVVAGSFQRWADFSAATLQSGDRGADPFVAAVGRDGFAWARSFAGDGAAVAHGLAAAPGARMVASLSFEGSIDLRGTRIEAGESSRGLVALLDRNGEPLWARAVKGAGSAEAVAIAEQAIFVGGARAESGGYLAALSPGGRPLWSAPMTGHALPSALAAASGGALVGGSVHDRLTVGRLSAHVAGESDGFVARFRR